MKTAFLFLATACIMSGSLALAQQTATPAPQLTPGQIAASAADTAGMAPALAPTDWPRITLSRKECIDIALRDNPTIRVADMEIKRMEY